jgi:hypothetical protein
MIRVAMRRWLLAVVFAAIIVAIAVIATATTDRSSARSGIRGHVTAGCIVDGCEPRPVVGVQQVLRAGETREPRFALVKRFRSSPDGTFSVRLVPGRYWVVQDPASPAPGLMKRLQVLVRENEFTEIDLFYDEGRLG